MKIPTAHEFFLAWREIAALRQNELMTNWSNRSEYTAIIQKENGCVISKVAEKLKLICFAEYYYTDAILFDETDLVPEKPENSTWLRGIKVGFEHEHLYNKRLYEEISHLLILQTQLNVVVTYPSRGDFKTLNHLPYFHSLINGSPRANELDANENFLLIFGYRDPLEWKGLVYKNDSWKEISKGEGVK